MKLQPAGKWYYWILLALLVKGVIFGLLSNELGLNDDNFIGIVAGNETGDAETYIRPVENLLITGEYDPDYRMPGYAVVYYLLRLFLNLPEAQNALLIIQYILSAFSVYVLALIGLLLFNSARIFYLVYFTFLISTYTQILDLYLLTESISVSASIFAVYFLTKGIKDDKYWYLFFAGLMTTWVIFLRPVYIPYLLFFASVLMISFNRKNVTTRKLLKGTFLLLLPFAVIDGIWVIRNYQKYNRIQPLTKSTLHPDSRNSYYIEFMAFLQSWGGNYIFWDPSSEARLLGMDAYLYGKHIQTNEQVRIPENIYTSEFNSDSLKMIRSLVVTYESKSESNDSLIIINELLKEKFHRYSTSVREEHPFLFHITSRLKYFKLFLIHSGTYNLMNDPWLELNVLRKSLKIFYSTLYCFVVLLGVAGSILLLLRYREPLMLILPSITIYSLIIFPWILRLPEMRYFVPAYPFMLICAMYITNEILNRMKQKPLITK